MAKAGIYCLQNKRNGKRYIGSSKNLKQRLLTHLHSLEEGIHPNRELQEAFSQDGLNLIILEYIDNKNKDLLLQREQVWINEFNTTDPMYGYNKINSQTTQWFNKNNIKCLTRPPLWYIIMEELSKLNKYTRAWWNIMKRYIK